MEDDFVVKDSGAREQFSSGMQRDTQDGKPRFDLIVPASQLLDETMIYRWAVLLARGAVKYSERNWEAAAGEEELKRFQSSAFRHFMQWISGARDEDHAAAVFFNINGAEYVRGKLAEQKKLSSIPPPVTEWGTLGCLTFDNNTGEPKIK